MPPKTLLAFPIAILSLACHAPTYTYSPRHTTISTDPPGARVYQISPTTGDRIDLGTTPLHDQPVLIPVTVNPQGHTDRLPELFTKLEVLRVHIEKPGYQPLDTNLPTSPKETLPHQLRLEPLNYASQPRSHP